MLYLRFRRIARVAAACVVAVVLLDRLLPPPLERGRDVSCLVLDHEGEWIRALPTHAGRWRFAVRLKAVDPVFVRRLIASEDKRFWSHPGFDCAALARAAGAAMAARHIVSGGSTITMQTARLLEPRPRTIRSKVIEIVRAVQIEARLSKREILELYLTLAPYGGNLEGVRAASLAYFNHEPSALSDAEMALLIALPQAPERRRPDRHVAAARTARAQVLRRFTAGGCISAGVALEASETTLPQRRAFTGAAYHAAVRLGRAASGSPEVHSTLDRGLQIEMESLARDHAVRKGNDVHAALLLVDNRTNAVRAAVGSAGLDRPGGWMDLTRAPRSPGSTLKPFVYGLAFDDGLAAPGTIIDDAPHRFSGYLPENFDKTFHGQVKVREALQHSLNVPAVAALERVGARRFWATLVAAGTTPALPDRADAEPGLAIALGGAGITLEELTRLYAGLAQGGRVRPLVWTAEEQAAVAKDSGYQLMTPHSAQEIAAILRNGPSPAGRAPARLAASAPQIAFKTGTSYGFRDAWAAGFTADWTIVVWVGRADGAAQRGETGRAAALPLLFDAFDRLPNAGTEARDVEPDAAPPPALATFAAAHNERPVIIFPAQGVELFVAEFGPGGRGVALASRGGTGAPAWYVDGVPVRRESTGGQPVWRPSAPGFYKLEVVDEAGARAKASIRVRAAGSST